MILLDTDVLSEVLRPAPAEKVLNWLASQDPSTVFTTTVTQAEILYGIEILTRGKRRGNLTATVGRIFSVEFSGRILPFDESAAAEFAGISGVRALKGRPISQVDALIAAIAGSHGATLATRNLTDFELCGITLLNPWH